MPLAGNGSVRFDRTMLIYAGGELVYQLTGANLSSPQTAEMNARKRAATITKWVVATNIKSIVWIGGLCIASGTLWPALGGGVAAADMYLSYRYAINSGLSSSAPGTESY